MTELITVMIIIGILSAVALPRLIGNSDMASTTYRTSVLSALRYGQKVAVSHRRLVCAIVGVNSVTLKIATTNPPVIDPDPNITCAVKLASPDGAEYKSTDIAVFSGGLLGTLYFQPAGTLTSDAAGLVPITAPNNVISIAGANAIKIEGSTGYVR
jgi:MSHA pilin protein MshC